MSRDKNGKTDNGNNSPPTVKKHRRYHLSVNGKNNKFPVPKNKQGGILVQNSNNFFSKNSAGKKAKHPDEKPFVENKTEENSLEKSQVSSSIIEAREEKSNAIIVDTNILIHDPESINVLRDDGKNILFVPLQALMELDDLKGKPDIGIDAREALRIIERILYRERTSSDSRFTLQIIEKNEWKNLEGLSHEKPDNIILASANWILTNKKESFNKIKFLSRDRMVRALGINFLLKEGLIIEDYYNDQSTGLDCDNMMEINVPSKIIHSNGGDDFWFDIKDLNKKDKERVATVALNGGIICRSGWNGDFSFGPQHDRSAGGFDPSFAALRKGDCFKIINNRISAYNIGQYSINGNGPNWAQLVALEQLMDDDIRVVFLQGGAGTGKTLLAMAAALAQEKKFDRILITRPLVHLGGEDNMGFLPGNINKKMDPWLKPIYQALEELKEMAPKNTAENFRKKHSKNQEDNLNFVDRLKTEGKISIESLDYIRGQSIRKSFIIVDEGQNLTAHQIKTIITRAGEGTKFVFTGDLSQIDRRYLDRKTSGLSYAIERLTDIGNLAVKDLAEYVSLCGSVSFTESVRSDLAYYAEKVL